MGGVSEERVVFERSEGQPILRLAGQISTANRGGFIQARTKLDAPLPLQHSCVTIAWIYLFALSGFTDLSINNRLWNPDLIQFQFRRSVITFEVLGK